MKKDHFDIIEALSPLFTDRVHDALCLNCRRGKTCSYDKAHTAENSVNDFWDTYAYDLALYADIKDLEMDYVLSILAKKSEELTSDEKMMKADLEEMALDIV